MESSMYCKRIKGADEKEAKLACVGSKQQSQQIYQLESPRETGPWPVG